jgi:hypothetical protein
MMRNRQKWIHTWLGASVGVAAAVLFLATVTLGYAAEDKVKGKAEEKPVQGQQVCPATPGGGVCQVKIECPPIKAPGKTVCKATVDCPPVEKPVKNKKKPKSE